MVSAAASEDYLNAIHFASPLQMKEGGVGVSGERSQDVDTHAAAAAGVSGAATSLPHGTAIRKSFGPDHAATIDGISAHVGGPAATAAIAIGAEAYATGTSVAFAESPDLHTAAHEVAHVVQQQQGVLLKGGVGAAGDQYEQHADAVADAVVRGESAAALLSEQRGGGSSTAIQRRAAGLVPVHSSDFVGETNPAVLAISDAADHVTKVVDVVENGGVSADEGCLRAANFVSPALVAVQALLAGRAGQGLNVDTEGQAKVMFQLHDALDRLFASAMRLIDLVGRTGPATTDEPPRVGAPTFRAQMSRLIGWGPLLSYQAATTLDAAVSRSPDLACPTTDKGTDGNCYLEPAVRQQRRDQIRDTMMFGVFTFWAACDERIADIKKAMERDAKFADVIKDLFVGAVVGLAFGPVAAALGEVGGAVATRAATQVAVRAGKSAASKGAGFFRDQLKRLSVATLKGVIPRSSDAREDTVAMIHALKSAAVSAAMQSFHELMFLEDEELSHLALGMKEPDSMRAVVYEIVDKYQTQIEPLGARDEDDSRNWTPGAAYDIRRIAAWIVGPGSQGRRLGVVKVVGEASPTMGAIRRGIVGGPALVGSALQQGSGNHEGADAAEIAHWIATSPVEIEFVQYVDDRLVDAAVATGAAVVPVERITMNKEDALSGLL